MIELGGAWQWARELQERALENGSIAVDATMGGGGDTLALCELVGENGHVYAFDIQNEALERTREKLDAAGYAARATLFLASHADMCAYVKEEVDCVVFNLGWLPGSRDKTVTTHTESTLSAVNAALGLLKPGGLLTVCIYPGHEEGTRELEALRAWAHAMDPKMGQVMLREYVNQPANTPVMIAVRKSVKRS